MDDILQSYVLPGSSVTHIMPNGLKSLHNQSSSGLLDALSRPANVTARKSSSVERSLTRFALLECLRSIDSSDVSDVVVELYDVIR